MELRERSLGRRAIRLSGVAAIALCTSLVLAVSASAKLAEYTAPVPAPPGDNSWIDFKLKLKKNKQTKKFRPVAIKKVWVNFLIADCSDGSRSQVSFKFPDLIPVSNRQFSLSDTQGDSTFEFSGRIPRNGPPTGKIQFAFQSGGPANPQCDSGSLSWTAKRLPPGTL